MSLVTVACKVTSKQKAILEQTASNLGLDKSGLIRKRILQNDLKLLHLSDLPNNLVVTPEHSAQASELMEQLQEKYPNHQASALIKAALELALTNEGHFLTRKLKNHLT